MLLLGQGARFSEGTAGKRTNTGAGDDVSQSCFRLRMSATELVLPRPYGRAKLGGAGGLGMLPSGGAVVVVEHAAQALAPLDPCPSSKRRPLGKGLVSASITVPSLPSARSVFVVFFAILATVLIGRTRHS